MLTAAHTDCGPFRNLLWTAKVRVPAFALSLAKVLELDIHCIQNRPECNYYLYDINMIELFAVYSTIVRYEKQKNAE
jgi:hypothetical protein